MRKKELDVYLASEESAVCSVLVIDGGEGSSSGLVLGAWCLVLDLEQEVWGAEIDFIGISEDWRFLVRLNDRVSKGWGPRKSVTR